MRREPLKVMAVTGSRADWGYLSVPLRLMRNDPAFSLLIAVTGQHLHRLSGGTVSAILKEGFTIAAEIDTGLAADDPESLTQAMGLGLGLFGRELARLCPDLMLILGDRYEILAAACAGMMARVPIAHLAGGDITEGAIDDAARHAITKLSHLHFPTNAQAAARIVQMGESPDNVHCVGSTGLDRLLEVQLQEKRAFMASLGLEPHEKNILVSVHPATLHSDPLADAEALLGALEQTGKNFGMILTGSNADEGGTRITALLRSFAATRVNAVFHESLGTDRYINALAHSNVVVGNSSSGIYEAPTFGVPTVNIGDRQRGRLRAASVIDCPAEPAAIAAAIHRALTQDCRATVNPYGDGHASERIMEILKRTGDPRRLLQKSFRVGAAA